MVPQLMFTVLMACLYQTHKVGATDCKWDEPGLKPWDSADSWSDNKAPKNGTKVIIPSGAKILLNVAVDLITLEIQPDAELVWADLPNLQLKAEYIQVDGAFHMGTHVCRLTQSASIVLKGHTNSTTYIVDADGKAIRKAILVREGGTFEVHGQRKTSWTKLAQSVYPIRDRPCAYVYNHSDHETNPFAKDGAYGLHVIVWNRDASVFDYGVYQQFGTLREFIDTIPYGKFIGMYANGKGLGDRRKEDFTVLDDVIEHTLGGQRYAKNKPAGSDSYSLITVTGKPHLTQEYYKENGRDIKLEEEFIQLSNLDDNLVFQVAISARGVSNYFRVLHASAALPILELADDVEGWKPGDKIVVASTDYDWRQAEVLEIIQCEECSASQIRVNSTFRYRHYGNFTYNVDERAEVGLLTRNIVIEGEMEDECYYFTTKEKKLCQRFERDTFGGHIKFLQGFESVHVEGAHLYHMGQQGNLGAYPLHYHMCDEVKGSWLRENTIQDSFSRCVTIHGTDEAEVSDNVCYMHIGHGFFLEDSVEQNNVLRHNLGLGTMYGTLLMSDSTKEWCKEDMKDQDWVVNCAEVSTFWLTHPNNEVTDNAAAGSDCHGFMYVFADVPLGISYDRQLELGKVPPGHAMYYPIKRFYNNVVHSSVRVGVWIDSYISAGGKGHRDYNLPGQGDIPENGIIQADNEHEPRDPPGDINGRRVWHKMERVTAYKNKQSNMWVKDGNLNVTFSSLADAATQSYSGGCTGFWTGTSLEYSVLIGRTDNLGEPRIWKELTPDGEELRMEFNGSIGKSPWSTITGVGIYQGPMYVKHSYFDRFGTTYWNDDWKQYLGKRPVSYGAAISFKKDATYPTYTSQYTTNLTFGYCDNENDAHYLFFGDQRIYDTFDWTEKCGPKNAFNFDKDGSLTGTPNTAIVRDRPFTTGPECVFRKDWGMSVCPYRYIKVEFKGDDGSLSKSLHDQWPLVARRDDEPQDIFKQRATQRMEYLTKTHESYVVGLNTSLKGAEFPSEFRVFGYGVERQDVVRLGLCVPLELKNFTVMSQYPVPIIRNNYTMAKNLKELDADTTGSAIFHDTTNGIIFFKIWSLHDRTNDSQLCTAGMCYKLKIRLEGFDSKAVRSCMDINVPPFKGNEERPAVPTQKPCKIGSPEGLGAVRWEEVKKIVHHEFHVPCRAAPLPPKPVSEPVYRGCFVHDTQVDTNSINTFELEQTMARTMTVDWCVQRCFQRNYEYAGLTLGMVCTCSHALVDTEESNDIRKRKCDRLCKGSPDETVKTCGNNGRLDVWTTGL